MKVIDVFETASGWVLIHWKQPGDNKIRAVKEVKALESDLRKNGMNGWLMESSKEHVRMHSIIERLGGVKYAEDEESYFYKKGITNVRESA